jgi:probable FeS assembly SUF system protein SufT
MQTSETVVLKRDCPAAMVPSGTEVTLLAGEHAFISQALGGSYTVLVNGNLFRIDGRHADALGFEPVSKPAAASPAAGAEKAPELIEREAWDAMRTCYDPEIPVNIVDLGLIYTCRVTARPEGGYHAVVQMTLTAPGCGMGPMLRQDVENKLLMIEGIETADVELVWDPPWNQGLMSEAAKLQLGLY